jgi:assimilatory nitrate reductase catalytic subunit
MRGTAEQVQREAARYLSRFDYAALSLAESGQETIVFLELAAAGDADVEALAALDALFGVSGDGARLLHRDARRGVEKRARIASGLLESFRVTGDLVGAEGFRHAMLARAEASEEELLRSGPAAAASRAVCSCYGVREAEIRAAVADGADLARVQKELRCGTGCGSCLPELRRLAVA